MLAKVLPVVLAYIVYFGIPLTILIVVGVLLEKKYTNKGDIV